MGVPKPAPSTPTLATSIERELLGCCTGDLTANVVIVAHHGSRSSFRKAFLDALASSITIVSFGPKNYSGVMLPDGDIHYGTRRTRFGLPHRSGSGGLRHEP